MKKNAVDLSVLHITEDIQCAVHWQSYQPSCPDSLVKGLIPTRKKIKIRALYLDFSLWGFRCPPACIATAFLRSECSKVLYRTVK